MADEYTVKPLPFDYKKLDGISEQTNKFHHDTHYAGYVKKRNEVAEKLKTVDKTAANANYSEFGGLKRHETFNADGQVLHELYWDTLGGDGVANEKLGVVKKLAADFGSLDAWKADLAASAKVALGWIVVAFDTSDGRIHNYACDAHNQGGVWGAFPLFTIDVYEHAYYHDYGPNRAAYIDAWFKNLDWSKIEERFKKFKTKQG